MLIAAVLLLASMATPTFSKASSIASAINSLLSLEEADQSSLLDTIYEYFTMPSSSVESDSENDDEPEITGKLKTSQNHT